MADTTIKVSDKMREIDIIEDDEDRVDDDLEDLDVGDGATRVEYQVWLLSLDADGTWTGWDYLIDSYDDSIEAQKCFDFFKKEPLSSIKNKDQNFAIPEGITKIWLCIEEVFFDANDEEEETNIIDSITLDYPQEV